jgi:hypothetical protein
MARATLTRGWAIQHNQAIARVKRSPKRTASWALAMHHSRGGMIHSFSGPVQNQEEELCCRLVAGEIPPALTVQRGFESVVYKIRRTSAGKAWNETT